MSVLPAELDKIFAEARQMPAHERATFVARACGTDEALRAEALSLLSADQASGDFLAIPALDMLAAQFAAGGSTLRPGCRLGAYTIVKRLGSGGAGEVWRARDERLGRDVAIKVLLPHLAGDEARLRRFADEARAAGALNHPNVLTVHDVGEHDGMPYLVSECLEGRTLRERLEAGPIPIGEAIAVALGVAQGLAVAHERGIVHRDLKPENTFLNADGGVKLLDFGLAKLQDPADGTSRAVGKTVTGIIAGTAGYMAPEQARGEPADPRSDLFALGVMLYEMLTGKNPFRGQSDFATLHGVLMLDPPAVSEVNERVPPALTRIVTRLLEKAPEARFQTARDLAWNLAELDTAPAVRSAARRVVRADTHGLKRVAMMLATLTVAALAVAAWWSWRHAPERASVAAPVTRFTWTLPDGLALASAPAVSPDGRYIAFTARDASDSRLHVRELGVLEPKVIAGTEGAVQPFWSPDGQSIAYFSAGKLMTVALQDGARAAIADVFEPRGGTWTPSGTIVYSADLILAGLSRAPARGGAPEPATILETARGDTSHWWPVALPDGNHYLYYVRSVEGARRGIYLGAIDEPAAPATKRLFYAESGVSYLPIAPGTAELLYFVDGRLEARRFDLERLEVSATARTLDLAPGRNTVANPIMLAASPELLAYAGTPLPVGNRVASYTIDNARLDVSESPEIQNQPRLSPDGHWLAKARIDETRSQIDIWVEDLLRGTQHPVTASVEPEMSPVWSPDGRQIAYVTGALPGRQGKRQLNFAAADGTGVVRSMPCPIDFCEPTDWSADGSHLLANVGTPENRDIWIIPLDAGRDPQSLMQGEFDERDARYSPDGQWIAYASDETGRPEVFVRARAGPDRRIAVSGDGGSQPVWRRDGKVLYYVDPTGRLRSVSVRWRKGTPDFGLAESPAAPSIGFGHWGTQYDFSPDGSRLYYLRANDDTPPREINVVIGWRALLK